MTGFEPAAPTAVRETLAVALQQVLASSSPDGAVVPDYEALIALLGLGFMTTACETPDAGQPWDHAQDAALVRAARHYGLVVRDLHPPTAATRLRESAEFAQHFIDSYHPLIRTALANAQPVLAWRGWPSPQELDWGRIDAITDAGAVRGRVPADAEKPVELVGPALQVYVVEAYQPDRDQRADARAAFRSVAETAVLLWEGRLSTPANICTGKAAWDKLRGEGLLKSARLAHRRRMLATWLGRIADHLPDGERQLADGWTTVCRRAAGLLDPMATTSSLTQVEEIYMLERATIKHLVPLLG